MVVLAGVRRIKGRLQKQPPPKPPREIAPARCLTLPRTSPRTTLRYSVFLPPKTFILYHPYMVVNHPCLTSMFCCWHDFLVPSMNVLANPAHPMLLVLPLSCLSAQQTLKYRQILNTVLTLLVYYVRWTVPFQDCTGVPKSMQKVLSEKVSTTRNALPLDLEGA